MNNFKKLLVIGMLATTALVSGKVIAATQGTLGTSSTGTVDVTLTIPEQFRISSLADYALGTYGGAGDLEGNDDVCVYHNGDGTYQVTITDNSEMTANQFQVENAGNTAQIAMSVFWNDVTGVVGEVAVTYNTPLASTGANVTTTDCSVGGLSANLHVKLLAAALAAAPPSAYADTVTLLVDPG